MIRFIKIVQYCATAFIGLVVLLAITGPLSMISYGRYDVEPPAAFFLYWSLFVIPLMVYGYKKCKAQYQAVPVNRRRSRK